MDLGHARALSEDRPGPVWTAQATLRWPAYRAWWLCEGEGARPTYLSCERAVRTHMPELLELWRELTALLGGTDLAARFLSAWRPPPFLRACSQAVWLRDREPLLVRNYDFQPGLWEGLLWRTAWNGRRVVAMSDCLWGVLDGVNDAGLAVALAFGGRREVGEGFGIPVVLRYVLQTCETVAEAAATLSRVPCHMTYSVTLLDRAGDWATVFVGPDREAEVTDARVTTNHQEEVSWVQYATATASGARLLRLRTALERPEETAERFVRRFLEPPVWSDPRGRAGWGTLYTAVYAPTRGGIELCWPGAGWRGRLDDFHEGPLVRPRTTPVGRKEH